MNFFKVRDLPKKKIKVGIEVRSVYLKNVMFTYFEFERGQEIPSHSHPHEQITFILEGEMQFKLGGEIKTIKAGEGVAVPSGIEHKAHAVTAVKVIDAWNPIRTDYIVSYLDSIM